MELHPDDDQRIHVHDYGHLLPVVHPPRGHDGGCRRRLLIFGESGPLLVADLLFYWRG